MIPKILHQIWLGLPTLPQRYQDWVDNLKRLHPDWKYLFWHNDNIQEFNVSALLKRCHNNSSKSNIIRIEAVRRYGGVYCDTDIEPLRAFDPLLSNEAFIGWQEPQIACSAVFGAVPNHPWLGRMSARLPHWASKPSPWGPTLFSENLVDVTVYPVRYFYPYLWFEDEVTPPQCSYTIHHWDRTWDCAYQKKRAEGV